MPTRSFRRAALLLLALPAACASTPDAAPAGGHYKVGKPYQIGGRWYRPADDRDYVERGQASWYGPKFHGRSTANGEVFNQNAMTAAHRTLPMPSYVEVRNLDNGRKVTVRINDRGPFAHNRIIDLSRRAAQLLGMENAGVADVEVTRVYPKGQPPLTTPEPAVPTPVIAVYVQVMALSDEARAEAMAARLDGYGPSAVTRTGGGLYRVRLGPFTSYEDAYAALAQVRRAGYADAHVVGAPAA